MILLLTSSYPAGDDDYRGLFVRRFAEQLVAFGHPVEVIAPRPTAYDSVPDVNRTASDGLRVHWIDRRRRGVSPFGRLYGGDGMLNNLRRHPLDARWLVPSAYAMGVALCDRARFTDAIVAHWLLPSGLVAALARPRHRRPVWIVCHSGGVRALAYLPRPVRHWIGSVLARHVDLLSCVTDELRGRLLSLVGPSAKALVDRCRVLPMGVECARFARVIPAPDGRIVVVARLSRLKGIDRLFRAVARHPQRPPLRVVGDGPERSRLVRLARRLRLDVELLGETTPRSIPSALDGCSFAVVPSRRLPGGRTEGLPTFALEALAAGLPLVATRSWQMPSELARAPGVHLVHDSIDGLTTGIGWALDYTRAQPHGDPSRRMEAVRAFDWRNVGALAHEWVETFRSAADVSPCISRTDAIRSGLAIGPGGR